MAVASKRPGMDITRNVFLESVVNAELFFPVDARDGAGIYGLLDLILRSAFGLEDFRFFRILIKLENLRTNFFATSATDAFILVNVDSLAHFPSPRLSLNSEVESAKQRFIELLHRPIFSGFNFGEVDFWHSNLLS